MDPHRIDYTGDGIAEDELLDTPYAQVRDWVDAAVRRSQQEGDLVEPLALSVATVDAQGRPDVRTVLMRFLDERGPGFVTALTSAKGRALAQNPHIAAALTWPPMFRAVRFRGRAVQVEGAELREYWDSRPWASRISAWASDQSSPIDSRDGLRAAFRARAEEFPEEAGPVPVPDFWGGYRIVCEEVEFWAGRRNRLHDRLVLTRTGDGDLGDAASWALSRRQP